MRLSHKAKWKHFYVGNLDGQMPVYDIDENGEIRYIDVDGVLVPIETGKKQAAYKLAGEFDSNFTEISGDATVEVYGLDLSNVSGKITVIQGQLPYISETSILCENEPDTDAEWHFNFEHADWRIVRIVESPNLVLIYIDAITK